MSHRTRSYQALAFVLVSVAGGCSDVNDPAPPFTGSWIVRSSGTTASLRGLHVVDAHVAWASGTGGTFLRTLDGGESWAFGAVPGAEARDFRDIHAWDRDRALVLSAGLPAQIFLTGDGGESWQQTYDNQTPGVFFNAVSFWDDDRGIAVGDPIDGRFLVIRTDDGGLSWSELLLESRPQAIAEEANFAASGTCMTVFGEKTVWFGTGGPAARVFRSTDGGSSWTVSEIPIRSGQSSQGVFSLYFENERRGVAVGGDYLDETNPTATAAVTDDGGRTWIAVETPPSGFRECVVEVSDATPLVLIAVGPSGTDLSEDGGVTWRPIGEGHFHSVGFSGDGATGIAVGIDGLVGRWRFPTE
jgi:photosystem II stability/assembly factor-like uncharacterized protein